MGTVAQGAKCVCGHVFQTHMPSIPYVCLVGECLCCQFVPAAEMYPGPRAENHESTNDRISAWWDETAREDLDSVLQKLKQYGSLSFHGEAYERLVPQSVVDGEEIAIAMYVAGKVTRIIEGIANREKPTDDTWDDIARYAMMARWVRQNGSWP